MIPNKKRSLSLGPFVTTVLPGYFMPALMVSIMARVIPDKGERRALARAAFTTIAIPSALAAAIVVLVMLRTRTRSILNPTTRPNATLKGNVFRVGLRCAGVAAIFSLLLVGSGLLPRRLFVDAIPSAALGGGIACAKLLKTDALVEAVSTVSTWRVRRPFRRGV